MTKRRQVVVVDGSNLATEGRTLPSLRQLEEAVTAFIEEFPDKDVVVVVDATFEHRVPAAERDRVKKAELDGDIVTPPAGAIGRGDAFVLKVALRADGMVLSNDSFQEFHAEHPWLFDEGRLIGGKPVPRIGWIFTPRLPVRGPRSKSVTKKAARATAAEAAAPRAAAEPARPSGRTKGAAKALAAASAEAVAKVESPAKAPRAGTSARPAKPTASRKKAPARNVAPSPPSPPDPPKATATKRSVKKVQESSAARRPARGAAPRERSVAAAPADRPQKASRPAREEKPKAPRATKAVVVKAEAQKPRSPSPQKPAGNKDRPEPVNTPRSYRTLVADHAIGTTVKGRVEQFTSHGALVSVGVGRTMKVLCYAPLAGLGSPAPTRARDVLKAGAEYDFSIVAYDPTRRRAELKLLGS